MPRIRARYMVKSLGKVKRIVNRCEMDPKLKALIQKPIEVEEEMYMVMFPQGHSIRVNKQELIDQKLHLKPRMVDMDTGDVIDTGGDPFDFDNMPTVDQLLDDDLPERTTRPSRSKVEAD